MSDPPPPDEPDADLAEFEEAVRRVALSAPKPDRSGDADPGDPSTWTPEIWETMRRLAAEPDPRNN